MRHLLKVTFLPLILIALTSCTPPAGDEEVIRGMIKDAARSASMKEISGVMTHIAKDYKDARGNDRNNIKGMLFGEFMRGDKIMVLVTSINVILSGEDAMAETLAVLVRGKDLTSIRDFTGIKDIMPDDAAFYKISLVLKKTNKVWKVRSAAWEHAAPFAL